MVWVDKRLEHVWSKIPILCLECALKQMDESKENVSITVLPESVESMFHYYLEKKRKSNESSKNC